MEERVQWCHGAPSALPVFALAWKIYKETKYLEAADLAAEYTYRYGVLVKGMSLCHGTSANMYMIHYLYSITNNPKYLYYVQQMLILTLNTPTLSDPSLMVSYDCLGSHSAFVDSAAAAIGTFADLLGELDGTGEGVWMLGWGKPTIKSQYKGSKFLE